MQSMGNDKYSILYVMIVCPWLGNINEYLLFPMDCIDINFSVIISSDIYDWINTSAGGVLVPESIIRPVVSASALTWFIRYIYFWNLQFLHNVIINKTKVLLPQVEVTLGDLGDHSRLWLSCLGPLILLLTKF